MTDLKRLRELFDAMLDIPAGQREAWFDHNDVDPSTRSELRRLAAQDAADAGMLDETLGAIADPTERKGPSAAPDPVGRRIGPFRILRRLGEGGMASVFLAQRDDADFEQTVALKLLRHGALSQVEQGYFRRERQVLARLSHPNIARLIDGGIDDEGVPYLAMEFVEGVSITQWCRTRACDVEQRIGLLAKVARAVEAAHVALVVHRDIKPSNVLVDANGEPRLLDFGIAKLLESDGETHTRPGIAPMTPEYAAPEQFDGGPITTATDVYALGVLAYELLTGVRPRRGTTRPPSAVKGEDSRSSAVTRRVRDDLDTVTMKALAEDPALRYPGAGAFADDLERYLAHQPVAAHPPSLWYRSRKFVQRHRGGVVVTVLLLIGILVSLALALEQARSARREADRARRVQEFLVSAVEAARAVQPRAERPGIDDVVKAAAKRLEEDADLDPLARVELLIALDDVARAAGDLDLRERLLRSAREIADTLPRDAAFQYLLRRGQASLATARRDTSSALVFLDEAEALPYQPTARQRSSVRMLRANVLYVHGKPQEAADLIQRILKEDLPDFEAGDAEWGLELRFAAGDILSIADRYQATIDVLRPALEEYRTRGLKPRTRYMSALASLAQAEARVGDLDSALAAAEASLALAREFFEPNHPHIARSLSTLGIVLQARGDTVRAAEAFGEALELRRVQVGPDDPNLISSVLTLGAVESLAGRYESALERLGEAGRLCALTPAGTRNVCGLVRFRVAGALLGLGRMEEAEREIVEALAMQRETAGERSVEVVSSLALQARIAYRRGDLKTADASLAQARAIADGLPDLSRNARADLGIVELGLLDARGEFARMLERADTLLDSWRTTSPGERYYLVRMLAARSAALLGLGRLQDARACAAEARAVGLDSAEMGPEANAVLERVETASSRATAEPDRDPG